MALAALQLSSVMFGYAAEACKPCTNNRQWPLWQLCLCSEWNLTQCLVSAVLPLASTNCHTWYDNLSLMVRHTMYDGWCWPEEGQQTPSAGAYSTLCQDTDAIALMYTVQLWCWLHLSRLSMLHRT